MNGTLNLHEIHTTRPRSQAHHSRPADPWPATETLLTQYEDLVAELQRQILILRAERDETRRLLVPITADGSIKKRCRDCPAMFFAAHNQHKLCAVCKKKYRDQLNAEHNQRRSAVRHAARVP